MENQDQKAKLAKKRLELQFSTGYIEATEKPLRGSKIVGLNNIYHVINPLMYKLGLKLSTQLINTTTREVYKEKKDDVPQLVLITEATIIFTWTDVETGYSEDYQMNGNWCNFDNYAFAQGSILTYFKRQYLMQELNIESDEQDAEQYAEKHMSVEEKAELTRKKMQQEKEQAIASMDKAADSKELNFIWKGINAELTKNAELINTYQFNQKRIIIDAISKADLQGLEAIDKATKGEYKEQINKRKGEIK